MSSEEATMETLPLASPKPTGTPMSKSAAAASVEATAGKQAPPPPAVSVDAPASAPAASSAPVTPHSASAHGYGSSYSLMQPGGSGWPMGYPYLMPQQYSLPGTESYEAALQPYQEAPTSASGTGMHAANSLQAQLASTGAGQYMPTMLQYDSSQQAAMAHYQAYLQQMYAHAMAAAQQAPEAPQQQQDGGKKRKPRPQPPTLPDPSAPGVPVSMRETEEGLEAMCKLTVPPTIYRDYFVHMYIDSGVALPPPPAGSTAWRIHIDPSIAYVGHMRSKTIPPVSGPNEPRALVLNVQAMHPSSGRELTQCTICKEYFARRNYFRTNPHCKGRMVLVRTRTNIYAENPQAIHISLKIMCASRHHDTESIVLKFKFSWTDTGEVAFIKNLPISVREWRRGRPGSENMYVQC